MAIYNEESLRDKIDADQMSIEEAIHNYKNLRDADEFKIALQKAKIIYEENIEKYAEVL